MDFIWGGKFFHFHFPIFLKTKTYITMRIAIIILGIIGLVVLGMNWDSLSPDSQCIPKEGPVLHSKDAASCPKCKHKIKAGTYSYEIDQKICSKYLCVNEEI